MALSINIHNVLKKTGYLVIFLIPTDRYLLNIPFVINLSLYRLLFIVFIGIFMIHVIKSKLKIKYVPIIYLLILFYSFSIVLTILKSNHVSEFSAYFINEIMGLLLIFCFINIYDGIDIKRLLISLLLSIIIPLLMTTVTYYQFFFKMKLINTLPLTDLLPIFKEDVFDTEPFRVGFFPRLGLPFMTPPHLAIYLSIIFFIVFFKRNENKVQLKNKLLLIIVILLIIGTFTRTVFISIALTLIIYYFTSLKRKISNTFSMKRFFSFLIIPITLISIISLFSDLFSKRIIEKTINITEDRHYLLILESFHIITESMQNLLVGIGDGNLQDRTGYYTFLPPHGMLNSYLTVLVHRGVIGFISVYFLYGYLLFKILNKFLYNSGINSKIFLFTYINILIAFFFYELRFVIPVWAFLAILATYVFNYENYERYS